MAQFDAGSIEAKLLLDEAPFIAGLKDAQRRADAFESDPIVKHIEVDVDEKVLGKRIDETRQFVVNSLGETVQAPVSVEVVERDLYRARVLLGALRDEFRAKPLDLNVNITGLTVADSVLKAFRAKASEPIITPNIITPVGGGDRGPGVLGALGGALSSIFYGGATSHFGLPGILSLGAFMGFGIEHIVMTGVAVAATAIGAVLGGALKLVGVGATGLVGMATDMAGIGQAAGDIRNVNTALTNLNTATMTYGKNSQQAALAQAQLNATLHSFSAVARPAVLAAAQQLQTFKRIFDQVTGPAEKIGAQIINQGIQVAEKALPIIGKFATENMKIIQTALQPLFKFLEGPGMKILTDLETHFQKMLPTAMNAFVNGAEVVLKMIDFLSQHSGGFLTALDKWLKFLNTPQGTKQWEATFTKLLGDFTSVWNFLKALVSDIHLIFQADAGTGKSIFDTLTKQLDTLNTWLHGHQATLHNFFEVHKQEVLSILGLIPTIVSAVGQMVLALGPTFVTIATGILKFLTDLINLPGVGHILVIAAAIGILARQLGALKLVGAISTFLSGGGILGKLIFPGKLAATEAAAKAAAGAGAAEGAAVEGAAAATGIRAFLGLASGAGAKALIARVLGVAGAGAAALFTGYTLGTYLYQDTPVGKWARSVADWITGVNKSISAINKISAMPDLSPPKKGPLSLDTIHGLVTWANTMEKALSTAKGGGITASGYRQAIEFAQTRIWELLHPKEFAKIKGALVPALTNLRASAPSIKDYTNARNELISELLSSAATAATRAYGKTAVTKQSLALELGTLTSNKGFQEFLQSMELWRKAGGIGPKPTYSPSELAAIFRLRKELGTPGLPSAPPLGTYPLSAHDMWLLQMAARPRTKPLPEFGLPKLPQYQPVLSEAEKRAIQRDYQKMEAQVYAAGGTPRSFAKYRHDWLLARGYFPPVGMFGGGGRGPMGFGMGVGGGFVDWSKMLAGTGKPSGAAGAPAGGAASYADMAKSMVTSIADGIKANWGLVTTALTSEMQKPPNVGKTYLTSAGHDAVNGFVKGLTSSWQSDVVPWMTSAKEKVTQHFDQGGGQWLTPAGHHVIEGFHKGLTTGWESLVVPWMESAKQKVVQHFDQGGGQWLTPAGHHVIEGFHTGVTTTWQTLVVPWLTSAKSKVQQRFAGAISWLPSYGRQIVQGLYNGLISGLALIRSWAATVKSTVIGAFAGAGGWLTGVGAAIGAGLASSLSASVGAAASAAASQAAAIGGQVAASAAASVAAHTPRGHVAAQAHIVGPAVHIQTAHFHSGVDVQTLMNRADFLLQARRVG